MGIPQHLSHPFNKDRLKPNLHFTDTDTGTDKSLLMFNVFVGVKVLNY